MYYTIRHVRRRFVSALTTAIEILNLAGHLKLDVPVVRGYRSKLGYRGDIGGCMSCATYWWRTDPMDIMWYYVTKSSMAQMYEYLAKDLLSHREPDLQHHLQSLPLNIPLPLAAIIALTSGLKLAQWKQNNPLPTRRSEKVSA